MKIIFLDIDGVLNNARFASVYHNLFGGNGYGGMFKTDNPKHKDVRWDFYNVDLLKTLMKKTHAKIVISSSWRRFHNLDHFHTMFILYGLNPKAIIGETTLKTLPGWIRGDAINKWLSDNDFNLDTDKYVILDDNSDFYHYQNLVQTDMEYGLQDHDMLKAIDILK